MPMSTTGTPGASSARQAMLWCGLLLLLLALAACWSKDQASNANFEQAINGALKTKRLCTPVSVGFPEWNQHLFPYLFQQYLDQAALLARARTEVTAGKGKVLYVHRTANPPTTDEARSIQFLKLLGNAGYLHGEKTFEWIQVGILSRSHQDIAILNEKGMAQYVEQRESNGFESRPVSKICYGELAVDKVIRFTAPADLLGKRVSEVQFTVKVKSLEDWAKPLSQYFDQTKERQALLVLTSDGWVVEKMQNL